MHSLKAKLTLLNIIPIAIAITVTTVISAVYISRIGHKDAEQALSLSCEIGKNNLNYYFKSVEQSVNTVSSLIDADLDNLSDITSKEEWAAHIHNADIMFSEAAINTNGAYTYYYRIDPEISDITEEKGFWYTNLDGKGFIPHPVTEITPDGCLWFWRPKNEDKAIWLLPYDTDSLDGETVLSYNAPVKRNGSFVGVVGIEVSYKTLGEPLKDIKVQNTGVAFVVENNNGSIIYHPKYDILGMKPEERPNMPEGFDKAIHGTDHHIEYIFEGVEKHAYWLDLGNGMTVVVGVPESEVTSIWLKIVIRIIIVSVALLVLVAVFTILYTRRLIKPLNELTKAAELINEGNYDVKISCRTNDEVGMLTTTFNKLISNLGGYIEDLNSLAYKDALTGVRNRSAFDIALDAIESRIQDSDDKVEFAIALFDCDDLKHINDKYGHDKGSIYLKKASELIVRTFKNSNVYRLGGDEFTVILEDEDYKNREKLRKEFLKESEEISRKAKNEWERVSVSIGVATYNPKTNKNAREVSVLADHLMYENKRERKAKK